MWVGSGSGLFRVEGERLVQVRSADGKSLGEVDDLLVETNGTMWIACWDRGPFRWDGKEARLLPAASGVDASRAAKVYRDGEGKIWFSTRDGVLRWDAASTNLVDAGLGEAGWALHRDAQGTWWTGGSRGLHRRAPGSTVDYRKADGLANDISCARSCPTAKARSGWARTGGFRVSRRRGCKCCPRRMVCRGTL